MGLPLDTRPLPYPEMFSVYCARVITTLGTDDL